MNVIRSVVAGFACLATWAAFAADNLITNGHFFVDGKTSVLGWPGCHANGGNSNYSTNQKGTWFSNDPPDGDTWALHLQSGTPGGDVHVTTGIWVPDGQAGVYSLSLDLCCRATAGRPSLAVFLDGREIARREMPANAPGTVWTRHSFEVPAVSEGAHTLTFYAVAMSSADGSLAMDDIRFELAYGYSNLLKVTGEPAGVIPSTPDYGLHSLLANPIACSLAASSSGANSRTNAMALGWTLYTIDAENGQTRVAEDDHGDGTSTSVSPGTGAKELVWRFAAGYKMTVVSSDPAMGGASLSGEWFAHGETCTATATPTSDDYTFVCWEGASAVANASAAMTAFPADAAYDLRAVFAPCFSVAPTGTEGASDSNPGTRAQPFATVKAAVARAAQEPGSAVVLLPGVHEVTSTIKLSADTVVKGSTGDWKDVIVDGKGGNYRAFELTAAGAMVSGVTIRNFKKTAEANEPGGAGAYLTAGRLANCRVTDCKSGRQALGCAVYNDNAVVERCVIDGNTCHGNMYFGLGYYQKGAAALGAQLVVTNNTAANVHSGKGVVGVYLADGVLADSLIAGNVLPTMNEYGGTASDMLTMGVCLAGGTMRNCTVVNHTSPTTPFLHELYGAVRCTSANARVIDCVITNNFDNFGFPCDVAGELTKKTMTGCTLTPEPEVVRPPVAYVDPDSTNPVWPYSTPETAATNVSDALDRQVDGLVVHVAAGKTVPVPKPIVLARSVTVIGDGDRENTVLEGNQKDWVVLFRSTATNAVVANLTIRGGRTTDSGGAYSDVCWMHGGGANVRADGGGTVSNCIVTAGKSAGRSYSGLGAYMDGGLVTRCVFHSFLCCNDTSFGVAVRLRGGALMTHSVVSNAMAAASTSSLHGDQPYTAAVRVDDGEVRNCLIVDNALKFAGVNASRSYSAGVYVGSEDGRVVSSTIAGNSLNISSDKTSGGVQMAAAGTVRNCIIARNLNSAREQNVIGAANGVWDHNVAPEWESLAGTDNVAVPGVLFEAGTWQLAPGTPLAGVGVREDWMDAETDLTLVLPRVRIDAEDRAVVDPGAYAYVPPQLAGNVSAAGGVTRAMDRLQTTLSVDAQGDTDGLVFAWSCDGVVIAGADQATLAVDTTRFGTSRYSVHITNGKGVAADAYIDLTVVPSVIHVRETCAGSAAPYGTPATAATNVFDALEAAQDGCTILVDDGTYELAKTFKVEKAVDVKSVNGPEKTVLRVPGNGGYRAVDFNASGHVFSGFTVENGYAPGIQSVPGGGNILVTGGAIVENCIAVGGRGVRQGYGFGIGVQNAVVRNCTIRDQYCSGVPGGMSQIVGGFALCVDGASSVVSNVVIVNNRLLEMHGNFENSIVLVGGGLVTHVLVAENEITPGKEWDGVLRKMGVVRVTGGTFANGTVTANNCGKAGWGVQMTGGAMKNCIVWNNPAGEDTNYEFSKGANATVAYSCTATSVEGEGNFSVNPKIRANRGYRISGSSPCARSGEGRTYVGYAPPLPSGLRLLVK